MTYAEVRKLLKPYREHAESGVRQGYTIAAQQVAAFDHAFQAIEDRAALVDAVSRLYECKSEVAGEPAIWWADNEAQQTVGTIYAAARHHMTGQESR